MTKKRGPKFGAVVAPPDATEKNRNIGAQLLQKGFGKSTSCGKIYFLWDYTKCCTQSFPPIFWIFAIFDRNFAKIVSPPIDENDIYVVRLKEQSILKKAENPVEIGQ